MKKLLPLLFLLATFQAFASTTDGYSLPITGEASEENFSLKTVKTRTEFRNETISKTCFRTVLDGYDTICREEPVPVCYEDRQSRRICNTRYERRCSQHPRYRQQAYTCYETISVPFEVFSHNVLANVNVKSEQAPTSTRAPHNSCALNTLLTGDVFSAKAQCNEFIVLASQQAEESRQGDTVVQNRSIQLKLLDYKATLAPVLAGLKDLNLEGQTLVFKTGSLTSNPNFEIKLFVERRKLLGSDETLINRALALSEFSTEVLNEQSTLVKVNLEKLFGGINKKRKHVIRVEIKLLNDLSNALNNNLPSTHLSDSITVRE